MPALGFQTIYATSIGLLLDEMVSGRPVNLSAPHVYTFPVAVKNTVKLVPQQTFLIISPCRDSIS